jgi:hypothetical protein
MEITTLFPPMEITYVILRITTLFENYHLISWNYHLILGNYLVIWELPPYFQGITTLFPELPGYF